MPGCQPWGSGRGGVPWLQLSTHCHRRPEVEDLDGSPQCPGLASEKPEEVEEEEEELEEEDEDSLAGKSQEDVVSPVPEPQGVYEEEEEEEEPPPSLAGGFDHTRRCVGLGGEGGTVECPLALQLVLP